MQLLAEMSKEEGTMVIVYPTDSLGSSIAAATARSLGSKN
jgi:hypothetical protein